jgi:RNA-binding protein YhbY
MELQDIIHRKANVIIGKSGLSQGSIKEIQFHIKKNSLVKVKILKSALSADYSKEKLIEDLIAKTNLHKIDQRGYSVILSNLPKK